MGFTKKLRQLIDTTNKVIINPHWEGDKSGCLEFLWEIFLNANLSLPASGRVRVGTIVRIKWRIFCLLELLVSFAKNVEAIESKCAEMPSIQPALWVFVSTLGELNAIKSFIKRLVDYTPSLKLVLITDHSFYIDAYKYAFPDSYVYVICGHDNEARKLATYLRPKLLVVGEIPCWPSDAPCRFPFSFLMEAKRHGATAFIINAWLYQYQATCRMDFLERKLFRADYLRLFDLIAAQNDQVRVKLIEKGANPGTTHVIGNLKFDALNNVEWKQQESKSSKILASLMNSGRPVIVAGCITNLADQHLVLDAFQSVRLVLPSVLLVIAPRHPEVTQRMQQLEGFLEQRALAYVFRSRITDEAISSDVTCLVLDTMGELRDYYEISHIAHVGTNHNVLEPIAYGKPVTVQTGWNETFPTYPVYRLLFDHGGLIQVDNAEELGTVWRALLEAPDEYRRVQTKIFQALNTVNGSLERLWEKVLPLLPIQIQRSS